MRYALLLALIGALAWLPSWWVRRVLAAHGRDERYGLTGAQAARRFLDRVGLREVKVERGAPDGDHYDPVARAVSLAPERHDRRTLAAVVVAAHEVGHAMQHAAGEVAFGLRTELARTARWAERAGLVLLLAAPLLALATRTPQAFAVTAGVGVLAFLLGILVHLVTLPVELGASFDKALPLLEAGQDLAPEDRAAARALLRAAALTYVAGAALSLITFGRWGGVLRR